MGEELIKITFEAPPSFSVLEYVKEVQERAYENNADFSFNELVNDLPTIMKRFTNDRVAKGILSHRYGELLAKDFRQWIRNQMDEGAMLDDAGASCEEYDNLGLLG